MGFPAILTLVFVIAKIMGYIAWSWWVVFLPILIPLPVALLIAVLGLLGFATMSGFFSACFRRIHRRGKRE